MTRMAQVTTSKTRTLSRIGVAAAAVLAAVSWAVPAHAHADEVSTSPEAGSSLATSPAEVSVTFDSGLLDAGAALVVTGPDGSVVSVDPPEVSQRTISVALPPDLAAGDYRAAFRVVSEDGHTVTDDFSFTVLPGASDAASDVASDVASDPASAPAATPAASAASAPTPTASAPAASTPAEQAPSQDGPPIGLIVAAAVLVLVALAAVLLVARRRD